MRDRLADWLEHFSLRTACAVAGHVWASTGHTDTCARCGQTRAR